MQQPPDNTTGFNVYRNELLDSAVELIKHDRYYPDLLTKAAALMRSLVLNHPFIDGNKRTAAVSLIAFLRNNGYDFICTSHEVVEMMLKIASGGVRKIEKIHEWIAERSNLINPAGINRDAMISKLKKFFPFKKS